MNTYTVKVEQLLRRRYEIEATSEDEAIDEALNKYQMGDDSYLYDDDEIPGVSIELNGGEGEER